MNEWEGGSKSVEREDVGEEISMKFCLINQTALPPGKSDTAALNNVIEQILCAESLGYDGFWLTEHHFGEYGMA